MKVLAIDPGTYCGWAFYKGDTTKEWEKQAVYGTWDLNPQRNESAGYRYLKLVAMLEAALKEFGQPEVVYYEQVERHMGTSAAHVYGAIVGHIQSFCDARGIQYKGIPIQTWKKHSIGNGNAKKELIYETMKKTFPNLGLQDTADALGILKYVIEKELV